MILALLPVLFHRIGLIIVLVSAVILSLLPHIYDQPSDEKFVTKLSGIMITFVRLGLAILVITGLVRLQNGIPSAIVVKLISAALTISWSILRLPVYPTPNYVRSHIIMVILICLTAAIGIWL